MACSEDVHFPSPYFPSPHRVAFKRKGPPRSGGVALAVQVALRNRSLPNMRGPSSRRRPLAPQGATAGGGVCAEHTWPSPSLAIIDSLPHLRLRRRWGVIQPRHDPCPRHKATASPSCRRCASRAGDPAWEERHRGRCPTTAECTAGPGCGQDAYHAHVVRGRRRRAAGSTPSVPTPCCFAEGEGALCLSAWWPSYLLPCISGEAPPGSGRQTCHHLWLDT